MTSSYVFFSLPVYRLYPFQSAFSVFLSRCPHLRHYLCFLFINAALDTISRVFHSPSYCFSFSSVFSTGCVDEIRQPKRQCTSEVMIDDKNTAIKQHSLNDDCQFLTPSFPTGSRQSRSTFHFICYGQTRITVKFIENINSI